MDAIPVKHFMKHVSGLYSNNQQGFSEDFEVRPVCRMDVSRVWCSRETSCWDGRTTGVCLPDTQRKTRPTTGPDGWRDVVILDTALDITQRWRFSG